MNTLLGSVGLALCLVGATLATHADPTDSFRIETRSIPPGFEAEARFLELLKNPNPTMRFRVEDAPAWDITSLADYISAQGIEFTDVNGPKHSHSAKQSILDSLRSRKGSVFAVFSRLSYIYSIPYKQISELHFSTPTSGTSVVEVAANYRLSFKGTPNGPVLIQIDYLTVEGD